MKLRIGKYYKHNNGLPFGSDAWVLPIYRKNRYYIWSYIVTDYGNRFTELPVGCSYDVDSVEISKEEWNRK